MEIKNLSVNESESTFILNSTDCRKARDIRHFLLNQIPVHAIEDLIIENNSTHYSGTEIYQRIIYIPLMIEGMDPVDIRLDVQSTDLPMDVMASHLQGSFNLSQPTILLFRLRPRQALKFSAKTMVGTGEKHSKWSTLSMAFSRKMENGFFFRLEAVGNLEMTKIVKFCFNKNGITDITFIPKSTSEQNLTSPSTNIDLEGEPCRYSGVTNDTPPSE